MKNLTILAAFISLMVSCTPKISEFRSSTESEKWVNSLSNQIVEKSLDGIEISISSENTSQVIDGFGACFNEMGWTSLALLSEEKRQDVMNELFSPGYGANFTICRMPLGANDFSEDWYSYNETDGDFQMKNFSIENDQKTLIPFIKAAKSFNSQLKIWASPWCPPSWMKYNKHYASMDNLYAPKEFQNGLAPENRGYEGTDMFIQEPEYLAAYAKYFQLFIQAYDKEGIDIYGVMPQNEFNSSQVFPSCCWTAKGLTTFIGDYLGKAMAEEDVEVIFGTMERANHLLVDSVLVDSRASQYIKGVGFQWAGKGAIAAVRAAHPDMKLLQTEQECGDGKNDWKGTVYSWDLLKHYLDNGVSIYNYWNISLKEGGISRWGWRQNSLVVVNTETKEYNFTNEYYLMKHISHYVEPGAYYLNIDENSEDVLAFKNPDKSIIVIAFNKTSEDKPIKLNIDGNSYSVSLAANSINTLKIK